MNNCYGCHSLKYSHEVFLGMYTGKILGLTGTPPQHKNSEKGELVQKYCPIKYVFNVLSSQQDSEL